MKLNYILAALALSAATHTHAEATPYVGFSLAVDHLSGKRYESLKNNDQHTVVFSNGNSLSANQMNGYLFFGIDYDFKNTPFFIAPEFQIGQGTLNSRLDKNVADPDYAVGGILIQRNLDPKLSRKMTSSLVAKFGGSIVESYRLYGLVGLDVSYFRYNYTYQNLDFNQNVFSGSETFKKSKWKAAPVFGFGIDKKMDKVRFGLECRFAPYGAIKTSKTITSNLDAESITAKVKPFVSTVMLRLSYSI